MEYQIGDIIKLKKPHPCGSQEWEILRVGADFRLKCMGCGHTFAFANTFVKSAFSACFSAGNMVKSFIVIYYSSVIREIPCA